MPIVEARALSYQQMQDFKNGKTVQLFSNVPVKSHNAIRVISILNPEQPPIFSEVELNSLSEKVKQFVFKDNEPTAFPEQCNHDFVPPADHFFMTKEQAKEMVKMIKAAQASDEEVFFLVHCTYGMCRSGAVIDFIYNVCGLGYWNCKNNNPQIVPNHWVHRLLFQEWFATP